MLFLCNVIHRVVSSVSVFCNPFLGFSQFLTESKISSKFIKVIRCVILETIQRKTTNYGEKCTLFFFFFPSATFWKGWQKNRNWTNLLESRWEMRIVAFQMHSRNSQMVDTSQFFFVLYALFEFVFEVTQKKPPGSTFYTRRQRSQSPHTELLIFFQHRIC